MTSRNRTTYLIDDMGERRYGSGTITTTNGPFDIGPHNCKDVIDGTRNDHTLEINKYDLVEVERLQGNNNAGSFTREYDSYVAPPYQGPFLFSHVATGLPSVSSSGTTALARTNPNRPTISLPVAVGELKDFPALFKLAGRTLLKKGASAYLSYEYGWKPLISDMNKLLDFHGHVSRRSDELHRLYSNKGLKRRVTLENVTAKSSKTNLTLESGVSPIVVRIQRTTTAERWATVRWLPTSLPATYPRDIEKMARRAVLGLGGYDISRPDAASIASDIWELLPWSWLVDWTTSVGDYLNAQRNAIPVEHKNLNVMTRTVTTQSYRRVSGVSGVTGGNAILRRTTLERALVSKPVLTADIPFLNGRQMSILGALGIQRIKSIR